MDLSNIHCNRRVWVFVLSMLIILDGYFHIHMYYNVLQSPERRRLYEINYIGHPRNVNVVYYKYPLVNASEVSMDFKNAYNSSYFWFTSMKHLFMDISAKSMPEQPKDVPKCKLTTPLGPIRVNKIEPACNWLEKQNSDVRLGGYYAPAHCRAVNRVAIIIPYRDRPASLSILLRYLHSVLKKQLLEYRIFVVEQYGSERFNRGTLNNIAFLETQRFGTWHCLIFHDVDLIPEDERIPYSCPEHPTHMYPANVSWESSDLRTTIFGGVTALTPAHYESVNGYSNLYWDWGIEDDDFYTRLQANNFTIQKYNSSIARYAILSHPKNGIGTKRTLLLTASRLRFQREDLTATKYNLVKVTQEKLYTHIIADVNPLRLKLDSRSLMQRFVNFNEKSSYGHDEFKLQYPSKL